MLGSSLDLNFVPKVFTWYYDALTLRAGQYEIDGWREVWWSVAIGICGHQHVPTGKQLRGKVRVSS